MAERIIELILSDSLLESTFGSSRSKRSKGKYELPYGFDELKRVTEEIESIVGDVKGERRSKAMDSDDEVMQIISQLHKGGSWLKDIAIYGEEGMGKTTLARNAYNNLLIVDHFDIRAWSTVSREYDRPRVIRDLLRSMNAESSSITEDEMIGCLLEKLRGKRYLIVFDDVWSFEASDRRKFMMLPNENNGSRIILTTRFFISVKFVDYFHKVGFMDEDTAWNLLQKKVFKGDSCPSQLEFVGKMIARSCRLNPLSIEVVSGILAAAYQTEAAWEDIAENINIAASEYGNRLSRIVSLSYTYLPHHVRPCLLYLAIFPSYQDIRVSKLIKLWVAEGLLNESEFKSFEETGEEHVEDLVRRSLVSVSKRKSNGRIKSITIHDLMRDVCLKLALTDSFILNLTGYDRWAFTMNPQSCRHVSAFSYGDDFLEGVYGSTIRTILLYMFNSQQCVVKCSIGNVRLLRILDLSNVYNYDLPEEVFELFHLRYLAFHCGFSISEAISNLVNLQTLIICRRENDTTFANLCEGIWRMPQLRHLFVFSFKLPGQKEATSALENLQTLSRVVNFICSSENLKMIPNLKKLALFYTNNLRDVVEDYELYNLIHLQKLEILKIEMDWSLGEQRKNMSCAFPPALKKLSLSGVRLAWEDMKTVGLLPNLQVLKLRKHACIGKTWETSEGGFSELTYLLIDESNLKNWITETTHFPKLKCLVLRSCLRLLEVPNDTGESPTLELIELDKQNKSLLCSAKRIQKDRHSLGDDHLQIRVV